ncbi:LCP family protein [Saccharothrix stipae]
MTDHEALIREAIAAEADQAVDHREVLAHLRRERSRRRPIALFAAATLTAAAAAVAVIVPLSLDRTAAPPGGQVAPPPSSARTVLLIGTDGAGNTDSIVLVRVAADTPVSAVWLPRNALVDLPGVGVDRLNSAYSRAAGTGQASASAGAEALAAAVESLTGVEVDHHAEVDVADFAALSDVVGGVDVCLRRPARDDLSGVDLPAGRTLLGGHQALAFLRQRNGLPNGDLDRVVRQQAFLRALAAKVVGAQDPALVTRVVEAARSTVRTDPDLNLLEFAQRITPTVRTAIIPLGAEVDVENGTGAVRGRAVDPAAVRAFTAGFFADGATDTPTGGFTVPLATETQAPGRQQPERDCVS